MFQEIDHLFSTATGLNNGENAFSENSRILIRYEGNNSSGSGNGGNSLFAQTSALRRATGQSSFG